MRRAVIVIAGLLLALGVVSPAPATPVAPFPADSHDTIADEVKDIVTVGASADTFVNVAYPDASFGRKAFVKADNNPKVGLFRFTVTDIPDGTPVISATLDVVALGDQPARTVKVRAVDDPWDESTTYETRPDLGPQVDTGRIQLGATTRFTVPVDGNGIYSFALVRTSYGRDNVVASSEHPDRDHRPTLTLRLGEAPAPPPPLPACSNGTDDDADELIDDLDPGCTSPTDTDETDGTQPPPPQPACSNGTDDDADGLIDDLDPGCTSPTDTDETDGTQPPPPQPACSNGTDDDADGLIDDLDPGCTSPTDTDETGGSTPPPPAACGNGTDDDADGLIDLEDPGCSSTTDDDEAGGTTPPPGPQGPFIAYQPGSFFNTPLPTSGVPVAADSAAGIAWHKAHEPEAFPRIRGVDGNQWGQAFSIGDCSDPLWRIPSSGTVPAGQEFLFTEGFHADADFGQRIPVNSDSPILVIDICGVPSRPGGFSLWAANVQYAGTTLLASGGDGTIIAGSFSHDSNGLDRRNPESNSELNERSRGAIPDAMVIRDDLLVAAESGANGGTLGHVLHMFAMETNSAAGFVSPMVGAESDKAGYGAEGQRIRVKESWRPPAGCDGPGLVIARTLQRYGAYLGDNSGSGSGIKAEQGSTYPGLSIDALGGCITWDDMEYIAPGWDGS